jgi:hypothetical protein
MDVHHKSAALSDFAILLVAYRRTENVQKIVSTCLDYGFKNLFIHLDGPGSSDPEILEDQKKIHTYLQTLRQNETLNVQVLKSNKNKGIAVSVISACNWAFGSGSQSFLIVLEDDCLPTHEFFAFCQEFAHFLLQPRNLILCGTNPSPQLIASGQPALSHYSLTWGWMTSRVNWPTILNFYRINPAQSVLADLRSTHRVDSFWNAGYRRAIQGFTDVWDTVLVRSLRNENLFAILPPWTLVSNVGDDKFATHTRIGSPWTLSSANSKSVPMLEPIINNSVDLWLEQNLFKIRLRHLLSTKYTLLIDSLNPRRKKFRDSLPKRLRHEERN